MGLFGSIGKFLGGAAKVASYLPGPVGTVSRIASGVLKGRSSKPSVSPAVPSTSDPRRFRTTPGLSTGSGTVDTFLDRLQMGAAGAARGTVIGGAVSGFMGTNGRSGGPMLRPGMTIQDLQTMPVVVEPMQKVINKAPPGYALVTRNGRTYAVLESIARKHFGYKRSPKPPISVGEWNALKKSARAERKAKRVASTAGYKCVAKARR